MSKKIIEFIAGEQLMINSSDPSVVKPVLEFIKAHQFEYLTLDDKNGGKIHIRKDSIPFIKEINQSDIVGLSGKPLALVEGGKKDDDSSTDGEIKPGTTSET